MIPSGQAEKYQSLDVGVDKAFKKLPPTVSQVAHALKNADITKKGHIRNPTRKEISDFISVAWEMVTESCIKDAFIESGIIGKI